MKILLEKESECERFEVLFEYQTARDTNVPLEDKQICTQKRNLLLHGISYRDNDFIMNDYDE